MIRIRDDCHGMFLEPSFKLFRWEGLLCCITRHSAFGSLIGYVAVEKGHPFYGNPRVLHPTEKDVCDTTGEMTISNLKVHGGITYAKPHLRSIEEDLFGPLWWFGFDGAHFLEGDLAPFETGNMALEGIYRNMDFMTWQTRKLATQLSALVPKREGIEEAAYNYFVLRK